MYIFKKWNKKIPEQGNRQAGMSYVELIVVLSIFSLLSGVVIYNYGQFQSKVDIKNLVSDIALKIVQAQKASLSGELPTQYTDPSWKPAYGVYFDTATPTQFIYFVDLDNINGYEAGADEILDTILITKNSSISSINKCYDDACSSPRSISNLSINFSRPSSSAVLFSGVSQLTDVSYVQISVGSSNSQTSAINVYPSGRIQIGSPAVSPATPDRGNTIIEGGDTGGVIGVGGEEV